MSSVVNVAIHRSQFPDAVRRDLLDSLRRRSDFEFHKPHYTPELVEIVARRYADDLRHFGYQYGAVPQLVALDEPTPSS